MGNWRTGRSCSYGDGCLDGWVGVVVVETDVVEGEAVDLVDVGIEPELGKGLGLAVELEFGLLEVVGVEVQVADGVDEVLGPELGDLGDHVGEQGVGGDVKGDAEEQVGTTLVELAAELVAVDEELEQQVARGQGHVRDFGDVPGTDDVAAARGVGLKRFDDLGDLIDGGAVAAIPTAPLGSVDGSEVAIFVGPLVPDADLVFLEVADVGVALKEPEELVDDGAEVELFGG